MNCLLSEKDCTAKIWQLIFYKFVISIQTRSALYPDCFPPIAIENQDAMKTLQFEHESDQNSTNSNLKTIFSSDWKKSPSIFQDHTSYLSYFLHWHFLRPENFTIKSAWICDKNCLATKQRKSIFCVKLHTVCVKFYTVCVKPRTVCKTTHSV